MIKGFRQIAGLTTLSRIFGFIRDICYSHFFGAGILLDAWVVAFTIPNLARRLFGEGAASASFIPVYSQLLKKNPEQATQFVNTVITLIFVVLAVIVLAGQAFIWGYWSIFDHTQETRTILALTAIMLPYMLLICLVAIFAGVLNVHRHFAAPAAAPIILNIFIISAILIAAWLIGLHPRQQIFFAAVTVIIAGFAQIAIQLIPLRKTEISIRPAWSTQSQAFKKMLMLMGPMIIGLTVTQMNTLADRLIAWWLSASPEKGNTFTLLAQQIRFPLERGSVSHLYFAQRLYQLPLGVFGISLAIAIFPVMSAHAAAKDMHQLARSISLALRSTVFIAIPATAGLILIAGPLIFVAFQHGRFQASDTKLTTFTLLFYAIGLTGFFAQQILTRAFYSLQESKTPMKTAIIAVLINLFLNLTLIWPLGTGGLAASTAVCAYIQVVFLAIALHRRLPLPVYDNLTRTIAKTIFATALMLLISITVLHLMKPLTQTFWNNILRLLTVVPAAAAVYIIAAKLLRIEVLSLLTGKQKIGPQQKIRQ